MKGEKIIIKTPVSEELKDISLWEKFDEYEIDKNITKISINDGSLNNEDKSYIKDTLGNETKELLLEFAVLSRFIGYSKRTNIYNISRDVLEKLIHEDFLILNLKHLSFAQLKNVIKILSMNKYEVIPTNDSVYVRSNSIELNVDGINIKGEKIQFVTII